MRAACSRTPPSASSPTGSSCSARTGRSWSRSPRPPPGPLRVPTSRPSPPTTSPKPSPCSTHIPRPPPSPRSGAQPISCCARASRRCVRPCSPRTTGPSAPSASGLIGLGEGLTPSGDDILTGLALLASQHGMLLSRSLPALAAAIDDGAERTGLLSATTMAHAAAGRGRQTLHDLVAALRDRDDAALGRTVGAALRIGHTSGADLLTGIRLAIDLERAARSAADTSPHTTEKEDHP
ncbi:DUF2877 domain-containing protein [Microbacterium sp. KUDC0406]|uniref:DUF2877 domain-containing protein n=1 Tax=Microbacterium sp. KUDC0406 TaxID=2909588 RepID=UPI001F2E2ED9|nr:DUF2877 domain-containing protein [Microbacterium sp. KUDC0406]UJP11686.1 DUF2877 domain-containing protein [Microbacterium sp. KUDC0406]